MHEHLDLLHDHCKDSFERIREAERSRDRLFMWVVAAFVALALQVGYPAEFGGSVRSATLAGGEVALGELPLPALLSATWVVALALVLRYCQAVVAVDRKYAYLHRLEDAVSPLLGGENWLYRREGHAYLDGYPLLLTAAWLAYVVVFPTIAAVAALGLVAWEWARLPYHPAHRAVDAGMALTIVAVLAVYRFQPCMARLLGRLKSHRGNQDR